MRKRALQGALSLVFLMASFGAFPGGRSPHARAQSAARPNILIILTDDQRAHGTYQVMPKTMSWFRDGGTEFPNGFVTTPLCCPSRASIFSGQYAHNHHVINTRTVYNFDKQHSIQYSLKQAGYTTGVVGKYRVEGPIKYFDRWATMWPADSYTTTDFEINGHYKKVKGYSTNFLQRKALDFLQAFQSKGKPWFLVVAPFAPHSPATPAPRYRRTEVGRWEANPANQETDLSDKPEAVQRKAMKVAPISVAKRMRRKQLRSLYSVDDLVGSIFSRLEATGDADNTLAFFLSDNGYQWYEHELRKKGWPYDDSVRVPFFVRWPGYIEPGAIDDRLVANIDIAPTIYEVAGVTPPYTVDGWSLFGPHVRDRLLLEYWGGKAGRTWSASWTNDYEFVQYESGEHEYYDFQTDPWQLDNRLADTQELDPMLFQVYKQLQNDRECAGTNCP